MWGDTLPKQTKERTGGHETAESPEAKPNGEHNTAKQISTPLDPTAKQFFRFCKNNAKKGTVIFINFGIPIAVVHAAGGM